MCFHSKKEYDAFIANRSKAAQRDKAAGKHAKTDRKYALIALRCELGNFVAGWHCDPTDPQDVANTILDLKTWHAGEFKYVDTSDVDKERKKLKLAPLDQDGLPLPNRFARPGIEQDELAEQWDIENKSAIPPGGINILKRQRRAQQEAEAERLAEEAMAGNEESLAKLRVLQESMRSR